MSDIIDGGNFFSSSPFIYNGGNFGTTIVNCPFPRWITPFYSKPNSQLWYQNENDLKTVNFKPARYTFRPRCVLRLDITVSSNDISNINYAQIAVRNILSDTDYSAAPIYTDISYISFIPTYTTLQDIINFLGFTEPVQPYTIRLYFKMYRPKSRFRKRVGQPGPCRRKTSWLGNRADSLPLLLEGGFL